MAISFHNAANEIRVFAARSRRQKSSWTEPPERFSPLEFYLCLSGCLLSIGGGDEQVK